MNRRAVIALLAALQAGPALALNVPTASDYDHRVKQVTFNAADIVQLDTVLGVATHIVLEEGERYITHAFGDSDAYAFVIKQNHVFIKPKAEHANTNLIIVTDRRSYKFRLSFKRSRNTDATYELVFVYPDTEAQQARANAERAAIAASFNKGAENYNLSYAMSGDIEIAPVNAWDNWRFTYFKFAPNTDMPAIYFVDAEGNESIVNRTTVGDGNTIIVVHKINPKWILRLGNQALAVFNEAYDTTGTPNETGTASAAVQRITKGDH